MTNQEAFNKVWDHFIVKKGPPSIAWDGEAHRCFYRMGNGAKCAVGVLISDDGYRAEMETKSASASTGMRMGHCKSTPALSRT